MNSRDSQPRAFSARERLRSFKYAGRGLYCVWATQHNARVHAGASLLALALAWFLDLSRSEWCAIIFAISLVWMAECLNTAVEFACDFAAPQHEPLIEKAKDTAAGAVLVGAIGAAAIGALVFVPHLWRALGLG